MIVMMMMVVMMLMDMMMILMMMMMKLMVFLPSVAPSFFHTCVTSGKTARMEDVERFKVTKTILSFFSLFFPTRFSADLSTSMATKKKLKTVNF